MRVLNWEVITYDKYISEKNMCAQIKKLNLQLHHEKINWKTKMAIEIKKVELDLDVVKVEYKLLKENYDKATQMGYQPYFMQFWVERVDHRKIKKMYKAYQDGRNKNLAAHNFLIQSPETEAKYAEIAKQFTDGRKFQTPDDLVYYVNNKIDRYPFKYVTDKINYKRNEYWESAKELLENFEDGKMEADCDGYAMFKYHVILSALNSQFPVEISRLRCAVVKFYGHRIEGHMNLVWAREDPVNDWVFIESTVWNDRNGMYWGCPVRYNPNYEIDYTFDYESEYRGVYK